MTAKTACITNPYQIVLCALVIAACADAGSSQRSDAGRLDASWSVPDATQTTADASALAVDASAIAVDASAIAADAMISIPDAQPSPPDAMASIISGGPCISGASGQTAYRIRWADGGNTTYPVYEINGLPDTSRDHTGAYGYQIGFTPSFVDPFLGDGGLRLDSSDFVDIEISTAGVSQISTAWLSIYGRSYHTTTSGSFNWQTFSGVGATPTNFVSNGAPYEWYSADMTTEIDPNDNGILIRIKAGPNSGVLVVNRIELCMVAQ